MFFSSIWPNEKFSRSLFKLQRRWGPEVRRGRARMADQTRGEAVRRPRLARPRRRPVSRRSQRSTPTSEWTPTGATRQPLTLANSATARSPGLAISRSTNRYPRGLLLLRYSFFSSSPFCFQSSRRTLGSSHLTRVCIFASRSLRFTLEIVTPLEKHIFPSFYYFFYRISKYL